MSNWTFWEGKKRPILCTVLLVPWGLHINALFLLIQVLVHVVVDANPGVYLCFDKPIGSRSLIKITRLPNNEFWRAENGLYV